MNEQSGAGTATSEPAAMSAPELQIFLDRLRREQRLGVGTLAGAVAALVGAGLWAVITAATEYQIGFMAIGVGVLVGFAMRYVGKGIDQIFGVIAALLSLLGCALGNLFTAVYFIAQASGVGFMDILAGLNFDLIVSVMVEMFSPIDIAFYAIAVYFGYKYAFRPITEADLRGTGA